MTRLLYITCEHYSNAVAKAQQVYFSEDAKVLETHRAYDIGAEAMFKAIAPQAYFSKRADRSRLLIELNRSKSHKDLFSAFMKKAKEADKKKLLAYYDDYRQEVQMHMKESVLVGKQILHVGLHSFTPVLGRKVRNADIGLLYDPRSPYEKELCLQWRNQMIYLDPTLRIRFNYPYLGKADGFTTSLRKVFGNEAYGGVELEVNQALFKDGKNPKLIQLLKESLHKAIIF